MFKIISVLFTLAFAIDASRLNHLRRLRGDSQDRNQDLKQSDFIAVDPVDSVSNDIVYCVATRWQTSLPYIKFLGLHRSLDLPTQSTSTWITCPIEWVYQSHGGDGKDWDNISLYTKTKTSNLWLSTLPDRLSPIDEAPEKFTVIDSTDGTKNIKSNYADDEFNGWSLLCYTYDYKLIYKHFSTTNQQDPHCQWQFIIPKPKPTTDSPITTYKPVTTDSPITTSEPDCYPATKWVTSSTEGEAKDKEMCGNTGSNGMWYCLSMKKCMRTEAGTKCPICNKFGYIWNTAKSQCCKCTLN